MECKRCGTKNSPGAVKCEFCGNALEEIITITMPIWKKCPVCGYTLAEDERFCRYCGKQKEDDEDEYEETEGMSNGMRIFLKIVFLFFVLVLVFVASFFVVQMLF